MTWDTKEPRKQARTGASQPQGWNDPGWWDETPQPAPKPAPKPAASFRAPAAPPLRRAAGQPASTSVRSRAGALTRAAGLLGQNGSNGHAANGPMAARKTRSRSGQAVSWTSPTLSVRMVVGFAVGLFGALFLATAVAFGLSNAYDGKIMPGVHVGDVSLAGLTREEAIAKLDQAYAYLSDGKISVTTPGGEGTITYQDAKRGPDSAAMADAAMSIGRGGDPVSSVALAWKTFAGGTDIPLMVKLDPMALETKLHELTGASLDPPTDYSVAIEGKDYKILDGAPGRGIDETKIATELIDKLANPATPSSFNIGGDFVDVPPDVTAEDAQAAIDSAKKMTAQDITLSLEDKTWTVPAATIHSWIIFGFRTDGNYGPVVNPAPVETYVAGLAKEIDVKPVEPKITYSGSTPTGITGGKEGQTLNVQVSAQNIEAYLDTIGAGSGTDGSPIDLVVDVKQPTLNVDTIKGFVIIGQVSTTYYPGESNGYGVNIALPAQLLNGQVIAPGDHFSFLRAVGPIDAAHGWKQGGVIKDGRSQHTGAMGGGICSASTTVFQAAAVAGLQIDERHAHYYWISRYALDKRVGLDATVYSNGVTTWDMRITNDTDYPIVIRSGTAGGTSKRYIYVQFWSLPTGRTTTFSGGAITNVVKAIDPSPQYVPSLPGGAKSYRKEYPTNGFDTSVTRTVVDRTGAVVHSDTWTSHYTKVDGWLQIAGTPPPSQTPTPTPGPPTPTPTPAPTAPPTVTPTPTPPTPPTPPPSARRRPKRPRK